MTFARGLMALLHSEIDNWFPERQEVPCRFK